MIDLMIDLTLRVGVMNWVVLLINHGFDHTDLDDLSTQWTDSRIEHLRQHAAHIAATLQAWIDRDHRSLTALSPILIAQIQRFANHLQYGLIRLLALENNKDL